MYSLKAQKGFDGDRIKFLSKAFDFLCYMPRLRTHKWQQLKKINSLGFDKEWMKKNWSFLGYTEVCSKTNGRNERRNDVKMLLEIICNVLIQVIFTFYGTAPKH